ncbi:hypothetical protein C0Q70_06840 [Pomacea canaliculata]|uniref:Rhodanese domain-containing protein n=1 Tax=Pomacea canaliculata TaxID=400727 RepID=A0A2T7PDD5_POMCA|nr:hypothetical protein C0Q70_06840 [Pomacea canaliculata]
MSYDGLTFIEPKALYNLLQQATFYSCLSDPNYLLLIDARKKHEFAEDHVLTAKKAPKRENGEFLVPYDAELECKQNIVIYDSNTSEFTDPQAPALLCGCLLWNMGSRNPVQILKGGYEAFSALYPFLRTQKIIYMPREMDEIKPYPVEVLPGFLYLGNWFHGNESYIQKDLKIKAHINVCVEPGTLFAEPGQQRLHIQVEDREDADLFSHFSKACTFIDQG